MLLNLQNVGGYRGSAGVDPKFIDIFQNEQDACRELGPLEPKNADDFVLDEKEAYAISLLKNFF